MLNWANMTNILCWASTRMRHVDCDQVKTALAIRVKMVISVFLSVLITRSIIPFPLNVFTTVSISLSISTTLIDQPTCPFRPSRKKPYLRVSACSLVLNVIINDAVVLATFFLVVTFLSQEYAHFVYR